jgi:hypothetical protein
MLNYEAPLLAGVEIPINPFLSVKPKTLKEILACYSRYTQFIQIIVNSKKFIAQDAFTVGESDLDVLLKVIHYESIKDQKLSEFSRLFLDGLIFFTSTFFYYSVDNHALCYGELDKVLTADDFSELQLIVSLLYNVEKEKIEEKTEEDSEEIKKIKAKLAENKKRIAELKSKKSEGNIFLKYVSRFSVSNRNANLHDVLNYTMYQFTKQFADFIVYENSQDKRDSLLAGADSKKVKYVHWTE